MEGWVSWGEPGEEAKVVGEKSERERAQETERQTEKENKKTSRDRDRKR